MARRLRPAEYVLVGLSVVAALVCARLCVWQLSRLHERRVSNTHVAARLAEPPLAVDQVPSDTAALRFRRVHLRGAFDYAREVVLVNRTRNGSPGVNIFTPLKIAGRDTAVLVNRGWVYAPDGIRVDLTRWHEGDSLDAIGYAEPPQAPGAGVVHVTSRANGYRWLDIGAIRAATPYPIASFVVVLDDTAASTAHPPRVSPPPLDEGPHLSYAIQWFCFALIAVVGMIFFIRRARRSTADDDFRL